MRHNRFGVLVFIAPSSVLAGFIGALPGLGGGVFIVPMIVLVGLGMPARGLGSR